MGRRRTVGPWEEAVKGMRRYTSFQILSRRRESLYQWKFPETERSFVGLLLRYMFIYREGDNERSRNTWVYRYLRTKLCASVSRHILLCCYIGCQGSSPWTVTPIGRGTGTVSKLLRVQGYGDYSWDPLWVCSWRIPFSFLDQLVKLWHMAVLLTHTLMVKQKFRVPRMCHNFYVWVFKQVFV